jgi:hypothetical protein
LGVETHSKKALLWLSRVKKNEFFFSLAGSVEGGSPRDIIFPRALVPLSHAIFNLSVSFEPANLVLARPNLGGLNLPSISINSMLIGYIVSFGIPKTTSLRKLAKRKISDVLIRIQDLLRGVIPIIRYKLITSTEVGGRRSFRSNSCYSCEGEQNYIVNMFSMFTSFFPAYKTAAGREKRIVRLAFLNGGLTGKSTGAQAPGGLFLPAFGEGGKSRPLLNRTEDYEVKHNLNLPKIRFIYSLRKLHSVREKTNTPLNPWFITGFTWSPAGIGEGCFGANFKRSATSSLGMKFQLVFSIHLHKKDVDLLKEIRKSFQEIGSVLVWEKTACFRVQSLKEITSVIIPHFDKYPLITKKQADYLLFREIAFIMLRKEHLTQEGLQKIVNIKASLNLGLSKDLTEIFPETQAVSRPTVHNQIIPNPEWVAGFTSGEGSFSVSLFNDSTRQSGVRLLIRFIITQHSRDEALMKSFIDYFGRSAGGKYESKKAGKTGDFSVRTMSDIIEKIIPFFKKYKIKGEKYKDWVNWCQIAKLMEEKSHLTPEGLEKIIKIKSGMNRGRKFSIKD